MTENLKIIWPFSEDWRTLFCQLWQTQQSNSLHILQFIFNTKLVNQSTATMNNVWALNSSWLMIPYEVSTSWILWQFVAMHLKPSLLCFQKNVHAQDWFHPVFFTWAFDISKRSRISNTALTQWHKKITKQHLINWILI